MWSNSSRCRIVSVYLTRTWCLYFIIIALDIVITLRFSINCSTVICSRTILFSFKREASSETYGPRVYFPSHICRSINQKTQKYLAAIYLFYFVLRFSNVLYLYLSDLILASDHGGINNPFIALGASVWFFVQVHRLETCMHLLLDWYFGSRTEGNTYLYFAASPFALQGKTNASSRSSRKNFWRHCRGGCT